MSFNRIAVYGHRGFANSQIVLALIESGAPITVLYRSSSDISNLPLSVKKIEVNVLDENVLIDALRDIDIVISLVGDEGVDREYGFVKAIPKTNVKLFAPSDLGLRYGEEGSRLPILKAKVDLESACKDAGIPTTVILIGNFAEFTLNTLTMGIDLSTNRLVHTANSANEQTNMWYDYSLTFGRIWIEHDITYSLTLEPWLEWTVSNQSDCNSTKDYVAAAYVSIFTSRPISEIQNRVLSLSELCPTGEEIATVMQKRNGADSKVIIHSLEKVNAEIEKCLRAGSIFVLPWFCRKIWGTGELMQMLSPDVWEVQGYQKATLEDLILKGKLGPYRNLPTSVSKYLKDEMF